MFTLVDPSATRVISQAYQNANLMTKPEAKDLAAFPGIVDGRKKAEPVHEAPEAAPEPPKRKVGRPKKVAEPAVTGKKGIDPTKAKIM